MFADLKDEMKYKKVKIENLNQCEEEQFHELSDS